MITIDEMAIWADEIPTAPVYWITRQAVAARRVLRAVEAARVSRDAVAVAEVEDAIDALAQADQDLQRHQEVCADMDALVDEQYAEACFAEEVL